MLGVKFLHGKCENKYSAFREQREPQEPDLGWLRGIRYKSFIRRPKLDEANLYNNRYSKSSTFLEGLYCSSAQFKTRLSG